MKDDLLKNNSKKLTQGQMGRREFIVSAMAAGLTLPSVLSLVKKAEAATPKKGGKLILGYGYGSTTDSLDPGTSENYPKLLDVISLLVHIQLCTIANAAN